MNGTLVKCKIRKAIERSERSGGKLLVNFDAPASWGMKAVEKKVRDVVGEACWSYTVLEVTSCREIVLVYSTDPYRMFRITVSFPAPVPESK